ncbi:MAG: hypothetical protein CMM92_00500 [Rickettsiales bacterium]|nr:hypothetical protein [Rickettsiales bacterium]RPG16204.1 MAG: GHKL domain-containing protein [Pelagibacteraceae bacterium TMED195]|tara:strand:+ start:1611 stop:2663 length:1053 start_codon:yes stop_codon:yes gene_type:complete
MKNENDYGYFRDFFDLIPDPLAIVNKKSFEIYYVNQEFQNFVKKSFSVIKNTYLNELLNDDLFFLSNLNEISKKSGIYFLREAIIRKNIKFSVICIVTERKNKNMLIMVKKETEAITDDLLDDYSAYEHFFSIFVHEITNPLSSIKIASQLLEKSKVYDSELIGIVNNECNRINKVINSISQISSKLVLKNKSLENIHEILRYSLFKIKNQKNQIKISEEFDPSLPKILIDKSLLIQAFENLLNNACEASSYTKNSFIKLSTKFVYGETIKIPNIRESQKKNYLLVRIEDNGSGIKKSELSKIFLPFFSTKKRGSGIGLYLVKRIINLHDGRISVSCIDNLTSFRIKLPL